MHRPLNAVVLSAAICLQIAFCSIAAESVAQTNVGPGTAKMAALLEQLNRKADPLKNPFLSEERIPLLRERRAAAKPGSDAFAAQMELAENYLNAGKSEEAIQAFKAAEDMVTSGQVQVQSRMRQQIRILLAIAHLRLGEQENCLALHGPESCLFPIRPSAVHKKQRGSRGGIEILSDILSRSPSHLRAQWLLNVAYMTVGEYPDSVPAEWRIDPKVFASEYDLPRFSNISGKLDLDLDGLAGGVVADDFDNDGYLDLMISKWGLRDQLHYYRNNGDGTFSDRTKEAKLTGLVGGLNMVQADYNNDGWMDVFVLRGAWFGDEGRFPSSLLRNNGDGTFEDVTEAAGLLRLGPTQTATWLDFNNDGLIDLFVGRETVREPHPCELYRNNGDGTFTECAAESGLAVLGYVKAAVSGDYDNDGRPDIYLSLRNAPNILLHNDGPRDPAKGRASAWKFSDVTARAGVSEPVYSFPAWFWDYDNDGWLDIMVCGFNYSDKILSEVASDYLGLPHAGARARLYRNNHDGTFQDVSKEVGLYRTLHAMGCNFGDLDNDGWLDFYVGTGDPDLGTLIPNRMFRNDGGKRFQDVTTAGGFGHLQKGHAIVFADFDNDGDQDIYESMGGAFSGDNARSTFYENPGTTNHWIGLKLEGVQSNRAAIGARIRLKAPSAQGERSIYKVVNSGGSFGANPLRQQIGIGSATVVDVEIFWPVTGKTQTFRALAGDRFYKVREGEDGVTPMELKHFKFSGTGDAAPAHDHSSAQREPESATRNGAVNETPGR